MNTSGIGLGLYITKMIVKTFQGNVYVESSPGHGSKFGLTFMLSDRASDINEIHREINPF